jgi:hypothetical protein
MMVAKLILLHFGAFVPGNAGDPPKLGLACGCPGFGCQQKCLGQADQNWPQAVGSGILNVVLKGKIFNKLHSSKCFFSCGLFASYETLLLQRFTGPQTTLDPSLFPVRSLEILT